MSTHMLTPLCWLLGFEADHTGRRQCATQCMQAEVFRIALRFARVALRGIARPARPNEPRDRPDLGGISFNMAPKKRKSNGSKPEAAEPAKKQAKGSKSEPAKPASKGKLSVADLVPDVELLRDDEETVRLLVGARQCPVAGVATTMTLAPVCLAAGPG